MGKILLACLLLTGCSKYNGPYHKCLSSHEESTTVMTTYDGKNFYPVISYSTVCDKYSQELYIDVDKKTYKVIEE